MSEEAGPSLFIEDQEQLDLAAMSIREGRRGLSFLVGPREIWPVATRYLAAKSGKGISEPRSIDTGEEMSRAMVSAEGKPSSEVESLAIDTANIDVLRTLNWQREKLRRGAHVLLWAESVEGLSEIAERAPDAYSVRDRTIVFRPPIVEPPQGPRSDSEPPEIRTQRLLFELPRAPEERAEAAVQLAHGLNVTGQFREAIDVATAALGLLPREGGLVAPSDATSHLGAEWQCHVRAGAHLALARSHMALGSGIRAFRASRRGAEACADAEQEDGRSSSFALLGANCCPFGAPWRIAETVESALGAADLPSRGLVVLSAMAAGRFAAARSRLAAMQGAVSASSFDSGALLTVRALLDRECGRLDVAEASILAARADKPHASFYVRSTESVLSYLFWDRRELTKAAHVLRRADDPHSLGMLEIMRGMKGDVPGMLAGISPVLREGVARGEDLFVFHLCLGVVGVLRAAISPRLTHDCSTAEPSFRGAIERAAAILSETGARVIGDAAGDPPWYEALFPALHADLLAAAGLWEPAIASARDARTIARERWTQAVPFCTVRLLRGLSLSGAWSEMGSPLREALEAAEETGNLRETALLRAFDLVRLLHLAVPWSDVERAYSSLQQTFTEIDGPRVEGETWLEVAPFFPPTATFPDPVEIAEHVHDLFLDMPMPGEAARSMEWLGDIHAARGESAPAETCYRLCLGTLERHGLLLRKPIVDRKLAALARR